jgi:hypothetical protein
MAAAAEIAEADDIGLGPFAMEGHRPRIGLVIVVPVDRQLAAGVAAVLVEVGGGDAVGQAGSLGGRCAFVSLHKNRIEPRRPCSEYRAI